MAKSTAFSLVVAIVALAAFHLLKGTGAPSPDQRAYVAVAVSSFNCAAILALFVILYRSEGLNDEAFGKTLRNNLSTVIGALLISFVYTGYDLLTSFRR